MRHIALVGCGFIGRQHALAYRALAGRGAELVAVCDLDSRRAASFASEFGARAYSGLSDLLANSQVDLVDVTTSQDAHYEPVLAAIQAGKDVFVEKPLATDLEQAEDMAQSAERAGIRLATNFNRRFGSGYQRAKAFQEGGRFGELSYFSVRIASAFGGKAESRPAYHAAFDLLIHAADLARFFGGEVRSVSAHHGRPSADDVYHNLVVAITFASGAVGTLLVSLDGTRLHPIERAEIGGTGGHGTVHNVVAGFDFYPHDTDLAECWRPQPFGGRDHLLLFYPTTIEAHIAALLDALDNRRPLPASGADGVAALRIVLAAIQSAETGRTVDPSGVLTARQPTRDR